MNSKEHIIFQVKAILIVRYISEYCELERLIRTRFQQEILNVDHKYKNKLYFYYGIHIGHDVTYDFEKNSVSLSTTHKFNEDEMFKSLNLNKILKFEKKEKLIKDFDIEVDSFIRKNSPFRLYDCCNKLMKMRNKLAHEVDSIQFDNNDIIEILSKDFLKEIDYKYIKGYNIEDMDENSIALLSNIIYMKKIIEIFNQSN